ncbi:MAG: OmpH family outer membrane protein [Desulfobacterales bacterium]|jgi:outer membrane protein
MRRLTAVGVCLLFLAFLSGGALAAEPLKIGILDFQKVLEVSKAGQAAKEKINEAGKKMEDELKQRKEKIEEERKNLERESLVMNQQARDERERQLRIQVNDFKVLQQKYFSDFKTQEQALIRNIQKEVFELAGKIGKEKGFSLILEKRESAALYFDAGLDITDQLIQRLDMMPLEKTEKSEKSEKTE